MDIHTESEIIVPRVVFFAGFESTTIRTVELAFVILESSELEDSILEIVLPLLKEF